MAKGDFQDYSDPSKNNFTRSIQNAPGLGTSAVKVNPHVTPRDKWGMNQSYRLPGLDTTNSQYVSVNPQTGLQEFTDLDASQIDAIQNPTGGSSMFDNISGAGIAQGIGAAANLANAYVGYKNYGLSKDKFAFEKASTNRNVENQAQQYNAELQNRMDIGLALGGSSVSPEQRAATIAQMNAQKISGAPIG